MTVNLEGTTTNNSDLGIKLKDNDEGPKTSFITLTFDNNSWNTAQTITVYPIDDLIDEGSIGICLLYTSPSPRDLSTSRMPSSA